MIFLPDFLSHPALETAGSKVCPFCIMSFLKTQNLNISHPQDQKCILYENSTWVSRLNLVLVM